MSVWIPAHTAPYDRDLEIGVIDGHAFDVVDFPCRRAVDGWISAATSECLGIHPTHWRNWDD